MAFESNDLDVSLYFDLDNNQYRIQDNSPYTSASPAIAEADIRGVYSLTDPNSNVLHENADYDNPDVATSIDADLFSAYESFTVADGVYTLVYNAKDVDTSTVYTKTFTFTYVSTVIPTVSIGIESNVGLATIESNDNTSYGAAVTLNARSHVLTFPGSWGSSSTTGAQIALTELYTGQYSTTITSDITITGDDNLIIDIDITGTQTHDVWDSDGMYALREPLATFYDRWVTAQTADPKEGRRLEYLWTEINANYTLYNSAKQNGDLDTASTYLNNIKEILAAEDIDTTVDPSESVPVSSSLPGYATEWRNDSGAPADALGRNGDFYIDDDTAIYYKKISGSYVAQGSLGAYSFSVTSGNIMVPTDSNGNNQDYTNSSTDIVVYKAATDDTTNWSFAKTSTSDADGTVTDNTLTITSITADTGYVQVTGSKTGASDVIVTIYVKKIKAGQAVIDITSVDDATIGINGSSKAYVKDNSLTTTQLDTGIVDDSTLEIAGSTIRVKGDGIGAAQIDFEAINNSFIKLDDSSSVINNDASLGSSVSPIDENTIAMLYYDLTDGGWRLAAYENDNGIWAIVGSKYSTAVSQASPITTIEKNKVLVIDVTGNILTHTFNGSTWSDTLSLNRGTTTFATIRSTVYAGDDIVYVSGTNSVSGKTNIIAYSITGGTWSQVGNEYEYTDPTYSTTPAVGSEVMGDVILVSHYNLGLSLLNFDGTDFSFDGIYDTYNKTRVKSISDNEVIIISDTSNVMTTLKYEVGSFFEIGHSLSKSIGANNLCSITQMFDGRLVIQNGLTDDIVETYIRPQMY